MDEDCPEGQDCYDRPDLGAEEGRCHGAAELGGSCLDFTDCNPDLTDRCVWDPLVRRRYCTRDCVVPDRPGDPGDCPARTCCGDPVGLRQAEDFSCLLGAVRCDPDETPCEERDDRHDVVGEPDDECEGPRLLPGDGFDGVLCGGDEDWFYLDVGVGEAAFVTLRWPEEADVADPDLELRRLDCGFLSEAHNPVCVPPEEGEELPRCEKTVALKAPARGRYLVAVRGLRVGQELAWYRLTARLGCLDHSECRLRDRGPSCQRGGAAAGICVDAFPCVDDDDCVGTRVCDQATVSCVQPCSADRHDQVDPGNDDCGPDAVIVGLVDGVAEVEGLNICPDDNDWFALGVGVGDGLEAVVEHVAAAGGLDVAIFDTNCLGQLVTSQGGGDTRRVRLEAAPHDGNYFVRVQGGVNVQNEYSLRLRVRPGGFCSDDVTEEDDTPGLAPPVDGLVPGGEAVTYHDRKGCEEDEDWFRIELAAEETLTVFLDNQVDEVAGDLDLELYGPGAHTVEEGALAFARTQDAGEELHAQVPADGDYYLRVYGGLDATYAITFQRGAAPCDDDGLENHAPDQAEPILPDEAGLGSRDALFCGGTEDWWLVNLSRGEGIEATLCVDDPLDGDLGLGLYPPGAEEALEEVDRVQAECETVAFRPVPETGDYYLRVFSQERPELPYTVSVAVEDACQDDEIEPNDTKYYSEELLPGQHRGLRRCDDNEDWYHVPHPDVGATLWFDLVYSPTEPTLHMTLYNRHGASVLSDPDPERPGQSAVSSLDHIFGRNEPTYKVRIWSEDPEAIFDYGLLITEVPAPGECEDDDGERDDSLVRTPDRPAGEYVDRRICPGNPDNYPVFLDRGQTLTAELTFVHQNGDLTLVLLDADGVTELARSEEDGNQELVLLPGVARVAGRHTVRVEGAAVDVANDYDLVITIQ